MNRIAFYLIYLFFLIFSGLPDPRSSFISIINFIVMRGTMMDGRPMPIPYVAFMLLLVSGPFILMITAYFRGKRIAKPRLILFPLAAIILAYGSSIVFSIILLINNDHIPVANDINIFLERASDSVSFLGPLILHIGCLVSGFNMSRGIINETLNGQSTGEGSF